MKRVRRWVFNLAAGVSLVLCILSIVFWVRSYWACNGIGYETKVSADGLNRYAAVQSNLGYLILRGGMGVDSNRAIGSGRGLRVSSTEANPIALPRPLTGPARKASGVVDIQRGGQLLGVMVLWQQFVLPAPLGITPGRYEIWGFGISYAWVTACLMPLPLLAWRRWRRQAAWDRRGLCPHCGYDLRATPKRCPECGMEVARASSS